MDREDAFTPKPDRILEIYSRLLSGEVIHKEELAREYSVNPRSIQRDIDSIRNFCSNRTISHGEPVEIKYDRKAKGFRMTHSRSATMSSAELFTISKILLESRSLNKQEMAQLISKLTDACLPDQERKKMTELVRNETFHYVEPRHGRPLIHSVWELASAIYSHNKIQMEYQKANGDTSSAVIKPVGIMESEYYFYLIAYIGDTDKQYPGYPTIYRIDRIKSYRVLKETFHIPYKDRFEEGEFRKRIPFMYGGKLHKVCFIYSGSDINVILDRLPTAQAVLQPDGTYRVTAEIFGDMGLNLWMNGQKDVHLIQKEAF